MPAQELAHSPGYANNMLKRLSQMMDLAIELEWRSDNPVHPELARALSTVPKDALTFLQTQQKKARSANGLGNSMRDWCDAAGLPLCSSHGLRKAICRRLAEAGCTPHEILSVSGHITLAEAQRYCEEFGRKNLSDSAIGKLPGRPNGEQVVTNPPKRFVKSEAKQLKGKKE